MPASFKPRGPVGPSYNLDEEDILRTKSALHGLGHYKAPASGLTPYADSEMFDAIRSFQQGNGLKVDGLMKPDGPTARTLGHALTARTKDVTQNRPRLASSDRDRPAPEECDHHFYNVDVPVCRGIERRRGKRAAARCYH